MHRDEAEREKVHAAVPQMLPSGTERVAMARAIELGDAGVHLLVQKG